MKKSAKKLVLSKEKLGSVVQGANWHRTTDRCHETHHSYCDWCTWTIDGCETVPSAIIC